MNEQEILQKSPVVPGQNEKMAFYSVNCCWWTSFPEDLGNTAKFLPGKLEITSQSGDKTMVDFNGLPCCPHCGSVLMQAPLEKFIQDAHKNPIHYGVNGLNAFFRAHSRNSSRCYKNWNLYSGKFEKLRFA